MPKEKRSRHAGELGTTRCPFDGCPLDPTGYCVTGGGYPVGLDYRVIQTGQRPDPDRLEEWRRWDTPFACPMCNTPGREDAARVQLDWDGGCMRCKGSRTPQDRTTWTFPGSRYDHDGRGHWAKTVTGPQPCVTDAEWETAVGRFRVRAWR